MLQNDNGRSHTALVTRDKRVELDSDWKVLVLYQFLLFKDALRGKELQTTKISRKHCQRELRSDKRNSAIAICITFLQNEWNQTPSEE